MADWEGTLVSEIEVAKDLGFNSVEDMRRFYGDRSCRYTIDGIKCGKYGQYAIGKTVKDATIVCEEHRKAVTLDGDMVYPLDGFKNQIGQ